MEMLERRECFAAGCLASIELPSVMATPVSIAPKALVARAVLDDRFENNDSILQATKLGSISRSANINDLVMADTSDWYQFQLPTRGATQDAVAINFLNRQGDLDLELYNSSGRLITRSDGVANTERISLSGRAADTYYVRVYGFRGVSNPNYQLAFSKAAAVADDAFENNDTLATATNLGTLTSATRNTNLIMADGHDWFRFTTTNTNTNNSGVSIGFVNSQGDLDLEIYNSNGVLIQRSEGTDNSEVVALNRLGAGTYYVHVYGYNGANNPNYTLDIYPGSTIVTPPPPPTNGAFQIDISFNGLTSSQRSIFQQAADRWERVITGDLPNMTYNGQVVDDLLINASAVAIDGAGGTLGQAAPDRFRTGSSLPYHGFMEFDTADLASMEADGTLQAVIEHEMGHVLGIGTIWEDLGLLQGAGTSNPIFVGTQATAAYNAIFNRTATGVPVENTGGGGTRDSHWRESILRTELMTGYVSPAGVRNPLSRITVGSLADMGYTVNFAAADNFTA
jgi:hypothetical protein